MTQLKSNLDPELLFNLIDDIAKGSASDYTFLNTGEKVYVSTHEVLFEEDKEINKFSVDTKDLLSSFFGKKVPVSRSNYGSNSEAQYSTFVSLFTTQAGTVRLVWLDGKILSMLIGSKPLGIMKDKENPITFSPYYFGFSPDSKANLSLTDEDKAALMALPQSSWLVAKNRHNKVSQNNPESSKSMSIANGYIRHGSVEKVQDINDLFFLMYPKPTSNFFTEGGTWGSGLPSLCKLMHKFEYNELMDTQLITTGEWSRYRDYDNSAFMASKDISHFLDNKLYYRFSFKSMVEFEKMRAGAQTKDLIARKYAVFNADDKKKYFDNPRYDVIHSADKTMFFVRKSDKLKATALQTRITKSLREDFIQFLNWIGYYQLAADLEPTVMAETFMPVKLADLKNATWLGAGALALAQQKDKLIELATEEYRSLYMNESSSTTTPLQSDDIFKCVFAAQMRNLNYHNRNGHDPDRLLTHKYDKQIFSFNKKFGLDINLPCVLLSYARGIANNQYSDNNRVFYKAPHTLMSFLTTNFLLSDAVEQAFEKVVKDSSEQSGTVFAINTWHLEYHDDLKQGQLLKTCVTLSPESLAIFNSVASLTTPTDILSWLELSKDYFVNELPSRLETKFGNTIGSKEQISTLLGTGIDYYMTILSAAEPFSNKLLNTEEIGE